MYSQPTPNNPFASPEAAPVATATATVPSPDVPLPPPQAAEVVQPIAPAYHHDPAAGQAPTGTATSVVVQHSVVAPKSTGAAVILAGLFGPLGMLYSTVGGAVVMFFANLFVAALAAITLGLGSVLFIVTWSAGVLWAWSATNRHNRNQTSSVTVGTTTVT